MPTDTILTVAYQVIIPLIGIYCTARCMAETFEARRGPALILVAYAVKNTFETWLMLEGFLIDRSGIYRPAQGLYFLLTVCMSVAVFCLTFEGGVVEVFTCTYGINGVLSIAIVACASFVGFLTGTPVGDGLLYQPPSLAALLLNVVLAAVLCQALVRPLGFVARGLRSYLIRYRKILSAVVTLNLLSYCFTALATNERNLLFWTLFEGTLAVMLVCALCVAARAGEERAKETLVVRTRGLVESYEGKIRERLAVIERDRELFGNVGASLLQLGEEVPGDVEGRVARLEEGYERTLAGSYCGDPALDAVLYAHAERLRTLDVVPRFSVAALPPGMAVRPELAFALLGEVCALASWSSDGVRGAAVDLRVRPTEGGALLHLEAPSAWGRVGAARLLRGVGLGDGTLVRETSEGDRTVVLVIDRGRA